MSASGGVLSAETMLSVFGACENSSEMKRNNHSIDHNCNNLQRHKCYAMLWHNVKPFLLVSIITNL